MVYCRSTRAPLSGIPHGLNVFRSSARSCRPTLLLLRCRSRGTEVVHPKKYHISWRNPPVTRNIKMQTKLPLCDGYRFAVFKRKKSPRRTRGVEGPTAPWQLKLQNLTLPMLPLLWQLDAPSSYISLSKNVRFHWRYNVVKYTGWQHSRCIIPQAINTV